MTEKPKVGDSWWRYVDKAYSVADEWGEHAYSTYQVGEEELKVIKVTPCGVWLAYTWSIRMTPNDLHAGMSKMLVLDHWTKKFACPTKKLALESYIAKKLRQERIYKAKLDRTISYRQIAEYMILNLQEEHHEQTS